MNRHHHFKQTTVESYVQRIVSAKKKNPLLIRWKFSTVWVSLRQIIRKFLELRTFARKCMYFSYSQSQFIMIITHLGMRNACMGKVTRKILPCTKTSNRILICQLNERGEIRIYHRTCRRLLLFHLHQTGTLSKRFF